MKTFSQRYGYTAADKAFQRERVDSGLRIALWNVLSDRLWSKWELVPAVGVQARASTQVDRICKYLWRFHLKRDLDLLPAFRPYLSSQNGGYNLLKEYFFKCQWFEVYDFLDALLNFSSDLIDDSLVAWLDGTLKRENAAYRIVNRKVVEITDSNEIKAIEEALGETDAPVRAHIATALSLMSDRVNPDYRNSVKESISAVEAACRLVTGNEKATLGSALTKIPSLHPALKNAFSSLYGFTSDASGVRHSLIDTQDGTTPSYEEAKFMLSSCAAFVSYLRLKAK